MAVFDDKKTKNLVNGVLNLIYIKEYDIIPPKFS